MGEPLLEPDWTRIQFNEKLDLDFVCQPIITGITRVKTAQASQVLVTNRVLYPRVTTAACLGGMVTQLTPTICIDASLIPQLSLDEAAWLRLGGRWWFGLPEQMHGL